MIEHKDHIHWIVNEDCPQVGCYKILRFDGLDSGWALGAYNVPDNSVLGYRIGYFGQRVKALKYRISQSSDEGMEYTQDIIKSSINLLENMQATKFDLVTLVPGNRVGNTQIMRPVVNKLIEKGIAMEFLEVTRSGKNFALKNIHGRDSRLQSLSGVYSIEIPKDQKKPKTILIVDDVVETGSSLTSIAMLLREKFEDIKVYALTATYILDHGKRS